MSNYLTPEQKLAAVERVKAGESVDDVAAEIGVHPLSLRKWKAGKHLGDVRTRPRSRYPDELREEAVRKYRAGESVTLINRSMNIRKPTAIYAWAKAKVRNDKKPVMHKPQDQNSTAPAAPVLRYCPCCGFRIDALIKAVNAMQSLPPV